VEVLHGAAPPDPTLEHWTMAMTDTYWIAAFSTRTGRTTIHDEYCEVPGRRRGIVCFDIQAETAEEAAAVCAEEQELEGRNLPRPKVCACAKADGGSR
jgi:hypothetical protein